MQRDPKNNKEIAKFLKGKNKLGAFDGDTKNGELLAGQIASLINI